MSENIRRVTNDRVAGLGRLFFLAAAQVGSPARAVGGQVQGNLELLAGSRWRELEATIYTAALDSTGEETPHGLTYTHEVIGFFAGDDPATAAAFAGMNGRRFAVLLRDYNDQARLAGADTHGLTFSYRFQSGRVPKERKGYSWSFKGRTLTPALLYGGPVSLALDGAGAEVPTTGTGFVEVYNRAGTLLRTVPAGRKLVLTSGFKIYTRVE